MTIQILIHGKLLNPEEFSVVSDSIKNTFQDLANRGGFRQRDSAEVQRYRIMREMVKLLDPKMEITDVDPYIKFKWKRYHMVAKSEHSHPTSFPPPGPFWQEPVEGETGSVYLVAYLPLNEPIDKWWPNAVIKEVEEKERIQYALFPKPNWWHDE